MCLVGVAVHKLQVIHGLACVRSVWKGLRA